ncbi:MAG: xanthine dehydrogenase family protein molybdopterin-binding subunit, partial [Massilia sp.]
MKFLTPATTNPIDRMRYVGQPTNRIDGKLKTTGTAPYAYEHHKEVPNAAQGFVVGSGIAKGRIASIDIEAARRAPGVLAVVTAENAGKLGKGDMNTAHLLAGPNIQHYHQAVALVVAETFEQARAAAGLVKVNYTVQKGRFDLDAEKGNAVKPTGEQDPPDTKTGNFARGFETSPVKLDATYHTPDQSHAMMEPHASTAFWEGDKVTVYTSNQMIAWCRSDLAKTLAIPKEKVRVVSPYVGGGFGSKLFLRADALLAALGARAAKRPVKVSLHRHLIFNNTTHRPATIQRIRIGAGRDGRIMAIGHETWNGNLPKGSAEVATAQTRLLYAGADRMTATRVAELDLPEGNAMRAPGEAPGMMALEVAMDEMAEKLNMDPVQFRILNDTKVDPEKPIRKFSERRYIECMRMGADKFGWAKRNAKPGQVREGRWLIGHGVASAFRNSPVMKSGARVKLGTDGRVTVETDMTDIGTGSYTIIAQTTAEMLGVPLDRIDVRL